MPQQLYDMRDGRMVPRPLSAFDAIGEQVFTIQYNAHCACVASLDADGAVMTAWSVGDRIVGLKTVFAPISLHDKIAATVSKEGAHLTEFDVKSLARYGFRVSRKIAERHQREPNYRPDRTCTFLAYMVPQDHVNRDAMAPQAPAPLDSMPIGAGRFAATIASALDVHGSEVEIDGLHVHAVRRAATLDAYSLQYENADSARRVHDRDMALAIDAGLVSRSLVDGEVWLRPAAETSSSK